MSVSKVETWEGFQRQLEWVRKMKASPNITFPNGRTSHENADEVLVMLNEVAIDRGLFDINGKIVGLIEEF